MSCKVGKSCNRRAQRKHNTLDVSFLKITTCQTPQDLALSTVESNSLSSSEIWNPEKSGVFTLAVEFRFRKLLLLRDFPRPSCRFLRSMSETTWENERKRTSAWARVESSSMVMLSSLQYCHTGEKRMEFWTGWWLPSRFRQTQQGTARSYRDAIQALPRRRTGRIREYSNSSKGLPKVGGHHQKETLA